MLNFKKAMSATLAACMVLALTACNGGDKKGPDNQGTTEPREDGSNPAAISSEVIKPTYFFNAGSYTFTGTEPVFETIKYYTNIEFEPQCVPLSSYDEKVATVLASGSLPDLLCLRSPAMAKKYALKGAFVNLTPYIDEGKMPNFINKVREYPPAEAVSKNSDGNIYGVPRIYDTEFIMDESWIIRYDILEKNGLELPTTFDEMYDLLVKLKELYPDSYPYTSRWGATHALDGQGDFRNARTTMMIDLDTRDYSFGPAQPGYIDCLKFMRDCYQNGLLHPEFATLSDEQFLEQFANNKAFMTYDYQIGDTIMSTNGSSLDEGFDLRTFVQPTYKGKRYGTWVLKGYYGMTRVISTGSEYEEELVRYLDWLYSEEGIDAMQFGIKGKMWNEDADGNVTFEEAYDPKKVENMGLHDTAFMTVPSDKGEKFITNVPGSLAEASYNTLKEAEAFDPDPRTPASWYNEDDQKKYAEIMTPINTYVEEMSMKVITGEIPLEDWETVVLPQCEKMGYKEALEMIRKALKETLQS